MNYDVTFSEQWLINAHVEWQCALCRCQRLQSHYEQGLSPVDKQAAAAVSSRSLTICTLCFTQHSAHLPVAAGGCFVRWGQAGQNIRVAQFTDRTIRRPGQGIRPRKLRFAQNAAVLHVVLSSTLVNSSIQCSLSFELESHQYSLLLKIKSEFGLKEWKWDQTLWSSARRPRRYHNWGSWFSLISESMYAYKAVWMPEETKACFVCH